MSTLGTARRQLPILPVIIGAATVVGLVLALVYLNRPVPEARSTAATKEAKAYLSHLDLKDVTMKATTNFMNQQVVEVEGMIGNNGPRPLKAIEVYCLFYAIDGHELFRQRVPVLSSSAAVLRPGQTRRFRLPFDTLPSGWNQAVPKMVIAQITFAE